MQIIHDKQSSAPYSADPGLIGGPDWNEPHLVLGSRIDFAAAGTMNSGGIVTLVSEAAIPVTYVGTGHLSFSYSSYAPSGQVLVTAYTTPGAFPSYKTRSTYSANDGEVTVHVYFADASETPVNPGCFEITVIGIEGE